MCACKDEQESWRGITASSTFTREPMHMPSKRRDHPASKRMSGDSGSGKEKRPSCEKALRYRVGKQGPRKSVLGRGENDDGTCILEGD